MLDFFTKLEEKHAFKKAVKELKKTGFNFDSTISRVYHNDITPNKSLNVSLNSGDMVDTTYFKDWRGDNKLADIESDIVSNEFVSEDELSQTDSENTDNKVENIEKIVENTTQILDEEYDDKLKKNSLIDIFDKNNNLKPNYSDIESFRNYLDIALDRNVEEEKIEESEESVADSISEEVNDNELNAQTDYMHARQEISKKLNQALHNAEKKDMSTIHIVSKQKPKKTNNNTASVTGKRTRGKAKRKFDADVITSIDWRD